MAEVIPFSTDELIRFIEAAGESDNVDAKAAMPWDGADNSASLTKDIIALANSRDGGVIVFGKREMTDGTFDLTGVSEAEAQSFETTRVADWINSRVSPPVRLVCHQVQYNGSRFVLISVREFEDVPVLCTRSYQSGRDFLLREGTIYVRTANAASSPLRSVEELRVLVGVAVRKRQDELVTMLRAVMAGNPLLPPKSAEEQYRLDRENVAAEFATHQTVSGNEGHWHFELYPTNYNPSRWADFEMLATAVAAAQVKLTGQTFPVPATDLRRREWGAVGTVEHYPTSFAATHSGLIVIQQPFRENTFIYKSPWSGEPGAEAGKWLEYELAMRRIAEFFIFASRMCAELPPMENVTYQIQPVGIEGRRLVTMNVRIPFFEQGIARVPYRREKTLRAELLVTGWRQEAVQALLNLFALFEGDRRPPVNREAIEVMIDKLVRRDNS